MNLRQKGFTLIEMMIVVAIVGVLTAISYPSYKSYMQKSRRADAKISLTKMADAQERYYLQNSTYTTSVADVGGATSADGYYIMSINSGDTDGFELQADADPTNSQSEDLTCQLYTLASTGVKYAEDSNGNEQEVCW